MNKLACLISVSHINKDLYENKDSFIKATGLNSSKVTLLGENNGGESVVKIK